MLSSSLWLRLFLFVSLTMLAPSYLFADEGENECVTLAATTENNGDVKLVATLQCDFSDPDPELGFDDLTILYSDGYYLLKYCDVHTVGSTCEVLFPKGSRQGTEVFHAYYYDWYGGPVVINFDGCNDLDNDGHYGYSAKCTTGTDCNDNDPTIYPGAPEICGDNKDNNCNGKVDEAIFQDKDGDGYPVQIGGCLVPGLYDCDDNNPKTYPGAPEICGDLKDNNCNWETDESCRRNRCMEVPM